MPVVDRLYLAVVGCKANIELLGFSQALLIKSRTLDRLRLDRQLRRSSRTGFPHFTCIWTAEG
jgi:hypothetical protein